MNPTHSNGNKLSEQIVELIDLTDANLEEIALPELGGVQGARRGFSSCSCGFFNVSSRAISGFRSHGSCSCGSCSCGSCSCEGFGSCSCEGFGFGSCEGFGSCSCEGFGSCEG